MIDWCSQNCSLHAFFYWILRSRGSLCVSPWVEKKLNSCFFLNFPSTPSFPSLERAGLGTVGKSGYWFSLTTAWRVKYLRCVGFGDTEGVAKVLRHTPFLWPSGNLGTQPKLAWIKKEKVVLLENSGMAGDHKITQGELWKCFSQKSNSLNQSETQSLFYTLSKFSQKCLAFVAQSSKCSHRCMHEPNLETVSKRWCSFCYEPREGEKWGDCLQGGNTWSSHKVKMLQNNHSWVLRRVVVPPVVFDFCKVLPNIAGIQNIQTFLLSFSNSVCCSSLSRQEFLQNLFFICWIGIGLFFFTWVKILFEVVAGLSIASK